MLWSSGYTFSSGHIVTDGTYLYSGSGTPEVPNNRITKTDLATGTILPLYSFLFFIYILNISLADISV